MVAKKEGATKKRVEVKSLSDFASPKTVHVEFEFHDETYSFPMSILPYGRWMAIAREHTPPQPPSAGIDPKTKRPLYNYDDVTYIKARSAYMDTVNLHRLVESLQIDIPGETTAEKAEALGEQLPYEIVQFLLVGMIRSQSAKEATAEARAATFPADGDSDTPDL